MNSFQALKECTSNFHGVREGDPAAARGCDAGLVAVTPRWALWGWRQGDVEKHYWIQTAQE
ncbi:hypothetical protein GCM10007338_04940 [Corynebacterium pelargi]|nr:hypothetical protein GCM10007338_04940 [Corynebacterium pelargi]